MSFQRTAKKIPRRSPSPVGVGPDTAPTTHLFAPVIAFKEIVNSHLRQLTDKANHVYEPLTRKIYRQDLTQWLEQLQRMLNTEGVAHYVNSIAAGKIGSIGRKESLLPFTAKFIRKVRGTGPGRVALDDCTLLMTPNSKVRKDASPDCFQGDRFSYQKIDKNLHPSGGTKRLKQAFAFGANGKFELVGQLSGSADDLLKKIVTAKGKVKEVNKLKQEAAIGAAINAATAKQVIEPIEHYEVVSRYNSLPYALPKLQTYAYVPFHPKGALDLYLKTVAPDERQALCLTLFKSLLAAVAELHGAGYCHRDLKWQNIVVSDERTVKLIDVALAYKPSEGKQLPLGTYRTSSPENCYLMMVGPKCLQQEALKKEYSKFHGYYVELMKLHPALHAKRVADSWQLCGKSIQEHEICFGFATDLWALGIIWLQMLVPTENEAEHSRALYDAKTVERFCELHGIENEAKVVACGLLRDCPSERLAAKDALRILCQSQPALEKRQVRGLR